MKACPEGFFDAKKSHGDKPSSPQPNKSQLEVINMAQYRCLICGEVSDADIIASMGGCDNCENDLRGDYWERV